MAQVRHHREKRQSKNQQKRVQYNENDRVNGFADFNCMPTRRLSMSRNSVRLEVPL